MKLLGVDATRGHAMLLIGSAMIVSGLLTVIRHPLIDPLKAQLLFTFVSGTFVPVFIEWLRETPTIKFRKN